MRRNSHKNNRDHELVLVDFKIYLYCFDDRKHTELYKELFLK